VLIWLIKAGKRKCVFRQQKKPTAMDRWTEIEVFVQVAELGSMSRAADTLGLSNAAASRHLAALEKRLAARLVQRNTRRLYLTDAGAEFFRQCKGILSELKGAEASVNAAVINPSGLLRITGSLSFCLIHVVPLLPEFTARYPGLRVEIVAANRYHDIIESGIDLAIRTREYEADSNITVRRLAETRRILAASPFYLQRHGTPTSPDDLKQHPLLIYTYSNHPDQLRFRRDDRTSVLNVKGLLEANDGQLLRQAAFKHMGILVQPRYIIHEDIVAGRLVPVLNEWDLPRLTINIAFQSRQYLPAKVRIFIDFITEHFRRMEYERKWTE
jgi:DNA-binding transcriptional LysR family regulator